MTQLKEADELVYFDKIYITVGLSKVLASTILEIKEAGYKVGKINFSLIKNENKKLDI